MFQPGDAVRVNRGDESTRYPEVRTHELVLAASVWHVPCSVCEPVPTPLTGTKW